MEPFPLKTLVSKLNPVCQRALEAAAGLCLSRTITTSRSSTSC